ncbi:hypothetical protein [Bradyrhizobium sp. CCBAU 51627]|uniref:hypothetical protein n=1 Tax=Bradyrhizobium sp. CCBAU 51627 TaxID=1325088 RepID=UPI0023066E23|nr:hypothetical protein [Bradyrhizobium sp. CCBAU 51627]MDA9430899.1 hypothetical protein [Bradyrhizobium sp. CCBAU 51627]
MPGLRPSALAVSALATIILTRTAEALSPLRIVVWALMTFALWAFCDEMGLRKPLDRAGFVCWMDGRSEDEH